MTRHTFVAPIRTASSGGAYVFVPADVLAQLGTGRIPVAATIDGIAYRGSVVNMGGKGHVLGVLKEIRTALGKGEGDEVEVVLEKDTAPRTVDVPSDLEEALSASEPARRCFDALAYSHKREYVLWIESAKREATRSERIARTVEKLARGEKLR
jgi:hypothetical protein